ncbi:MAG: glycosyltransferase [Chloroflexi bacterium]|nr:glycosyltransferase [Chloroflexota bacterium]
MQRNTALCVIIVDSATALGGAEIFLLLLLQHLDKERVYPILACNPGPMAEAGQRIGVEVHTVPLPRLRRSLFAPAALLRGSYALAKLLSSRRAEVVVSNTMRASYYTALAAGHIPLVWFVHDIYAPGRYVHWMAEHAKLAVAVSSSAATSLPKELPRIILPNCLDLPAFDAEISRLPNPRSSWGIGITVPVIGMIGSLRPWKGHADFIRAMTVVHQVLPQARFVLVGGDIFGLGNQYEQELRQLAAQSGLQESLIFAGQRDDIAAVVRSLNILVHCSTEPEAFGRVIIEAMAAEVPVIAYNRAGPGEIVQDQKSGILVQAGDIQALAEACQRLIVNPAWARELGRQGRSIVQNRYEITQGVNRFADALLTVTGGVR